jgi:ribonuclease HI
MDNTFHVFTDGSVIGNPGPGGWAAVLTSSDKRWEISGASAWTTISEMELVAAVEALHSIPVGSDVRLCSDSELLIHGMLFHIERWQSKGWHNSRGTPLQHQGLWRELLAMNERMNIHWHGSGDTAYIRSRPEPTHSPTKLRAPNGATCNWLHNHSTPPGSQAVLPVSQYFGDKQ